MKICAPTANFFRYIIQFPAAYSVFIGLSDGQLSHSLSMFLDSVSHSILGNIFPG